MNSSFLVTVIQGAKLCSQKSIVTVANMWSNDSVLSECKKVDGGRGLSHSFKRHQSMHSNVNCLELMTLDIHSVVELFSSTDLEGHFVFTLSFWGSVMWGGDLRIKNSFSVRGWYSKCRFILARFRMCYWLQPQAPDLATAVILSHRAYSKLIDHFPWEVHTFGTSVLLFVVTMV